MTKESLGILERCRAGLDVYGPDEVNLEVLYQLARDGYCRLEEETLACTTYVLTAQGEEYLQATKDEPNNSAKQASNKAHQKRSEQRFQLLNTLLNASLPVIFGLVISNWHRIVSFFFSLVEIVCQHLGK